VQTRISYLACVHPFHDKPHANTHNPICCFLFYFLKAKCTKILPYLYHKNDASHQIASSETTFLAFGEFLFNDNNFCNTCICSNLTQREQEKEMKYQQAMYHA